VSEERRGPNAGAIIAGMALMLFGLCLFTVGGGCTLLWLSVLTGGGAKGDAMGLLMLSLFAAALGLGAIVGAVKLWRGPKREG
jgi:hypothetical protein